MEREDEERIISYWKKWVLALALKVTKDLVWRRSVGKLFQTFVALCRKVFESNLFLVLCTRIFFSDPALVFTPCLLLYDPLLSISFQKEHFYGEYESLQIGTYLYSFFSALFYEIYFYWKKNISSHVAETVSIIWGHFFGIMGLPLVEQV